MKNRWNYQGLGQVAYGDIRSYELACSWLDETGGTVEDWGCGCAFAKRFITKSKYIGIDGSQNEFADVCGVDLAEFSSYPDSILMRHVLDHNEQWAKILDNAISSFKRRMALIFFIQFGIETRVLSRSSDPKYPGVPDIQFSRSDIIPRIEKYLFKEQEIPLQGWITDTIFFLEKK